jgi:exodeoxyribonuclease VII large subunit
VSRLNQVVSDTIQRESRLQNIWVEGEIYNLTYHNSGHIYFSLKDERASVGCTFFSAANKNFRDIRLRDGMKIVAKGSVSVYQQRGSYQLNVTQVLATGEGELRIKIEQLKKKLYAEGLFDPKRKRKLPILPITLGVATAPTGAAIQDIIRVARYRFPNINILLAPCLVQGEEAIGSIIAAIDALNRPEFEVDVIIAGRGGGSFEDLLAFNDESVVRAYHNSRVPIISAVGHEIDTPLTDLAADAAAPTPSAAAESAVPVIADLLERLDESEHRLRSALFNQHRNEQSRLFQIMKSRVYLNPVSILEPFQQSIDIASKDLIQKKSDFLREAKERVKRHDSIDLFYEKRIASLRNGFSIATERLNNFSPLATLGRGYSVVRNLKGDVIRSGGDVTPGETLDVLLAEGGLTVEVRSIRDSHFSET